MPNKNKTMLEVAKELKISKELVKYHKKNMPEFYWFEDNGKIYLTPFGVDYIKSKLRKDPQAYSEGFESRVMEQLAEIRIEQAMQKELLLLVRRKLDYILSMIPDEE